MSEKNSIDIDIKNYSIDELIKLFKLKTLTKESINNSLDSWSKKVSNENLKNFISDARNKLLHTMMHNKSFLSNTYKTDHIPNRYHSAETTNEDTHFVKSKMTLPIDETYNIPVTRGQINPNLKNVKKRLLNIDSQYRPNLSDSTTNYTIDLSEPLNKIIKMRLVDFEIKHSWYTIDQEYGTDSLLQNGGEIVIEEGNYSITNLVATLNTLLQDTTVSYSEIKNRITFQNDSVSENEYIFYDKLNAKKSTLNSNLGWLLGYRTIDSSGNMSLKLNVGESYEFSDANLDLYGPKYLLLGVNDYNQNMVNSGVVTIYDTKEKVKLPEYYTPDISCNDPLLNKDGSRSGLTVKQAYTISEILEQNREIERESRNNIVSSSDVLGKIQVNRNNDYDMIYDNNISERNNAREYYGPVSISRMRITLYDDKGMILNNNNQNYSFTLEVEELYQY